ncbi:MAG: LPXTG cell wall anchor domain-containing protein, partial [Limosilactobacillus mucosae]
KPSVPDSSSSADTPADPGSNTTNDSGSQSAALPGNTPADSNNSATDKPSVPDSSSSADTPADPGSNTTNDSGSQSAALPGDTPADSNSSATDKPSVPDSSSSADTPSPLVIADNSTNPTVAIDQTSEASTSNRPANQATANQQLPQTGNKNSALLGLGLSALAAMLGIGGKRLKRD